MLRAGAGVNRTYSSTGSAWMTRDHTVNSVDNKPLDRADLKNDELVLCSRRLYPPAGMGTDLPKDRFCPVSTPPTTNTKKYLSIFRICDGVHSSRQGTGVYREIEGDAGAMGDAT